MSTTLQNFYKATITKNWTATTGDFNVSVKPTTSSGWLVISANNTTLREIVFFSATGTNAYGDYVTISSVGDRGLGGTTAQTHTIGETIRMNITSLHWADMQSDIDAIIAAGAPNASETAKGLFEEATDAEVTAGTATGATGAKLAVTPAKLATRISAVLPATIATVPTPAFPSFTITTQQFTGNTTLQVGKVFIPAAITANKISIRAVAFGSTTTGTFKLALFSESGSTQYFSVTTGTSADGTTMSTALSAVVIPAGYYYFALLPVGSVNQGLRYYALSSTYSELSDISTEPNLAGTITVTADTMPSTITPTAITASTTSTVVFRLDN